MSKLLKQFWISYRSICCNWRSFWRIVYQPKTIENEKNFLTNQLNKNHQKSNIGCAFNQQSACRKLWLCHNQHKVILLYYNKPYTLSYKPFKFGLLIKVFWIWKNAVHHLKMVNDIAQVKDYNKSMTIMNKKSNLWFKWT